MSNDYRTPMPLNFTSAEVEVNLYSERCVQLYLTPQAAQFVVDLMRCIGGSSRTSRRFYADSIEKAMLRAGVVPTVDYDYVSRNHGLSAQRGAFSPVDFPLDAGIYILEEEK